MDHHPNRNPNGSGGAESTNDASFFDFFIDADSPGLADAPQGGGFSGGLSPTTQQPLPASSAQSSVKPTAAPTPAPPASTPIPTAAVATGTTTVTSIPSTNMPSLPPSLPTGSEDSPLPNFNFLAQISHIMQLISKGDDRSEIARQVAKLMDQFDQCEMIVNQLPGADRSTTQQEERLQHAKAFLQKRTNQVEHYLTLPIFNCSEQPNGQ
ncbi:hypothetical protein H4R33_006748 [Dimargaris cristalligena]|nr:hypothetical protein H4R33_006748 [Dimargaris cristalligena]